MIDQINMYGMNMVEVAIERFKAFEPKEGYFLAFSGGKDSCVIGGGLELAEKKSHRMSNYDPDHPTEEMMYHCQMWARKMLNPIIDWTEDEVWEFIHKYNVPYCKLYDEGHTRLGCIGCPMGTVQHRLQEFERYPKYKQAYIRAFDRMIEERNRGGTTIHKSHRDRKRTL